MTVKLSKKRETVYIARCQWAVGTDRDGNEIVPFGLLWERKDSSDALIIVEEFALKTYEFGGETRRYHVWLEEVTRYDDGSEESVKVREYHRPSDSETETLTVTRELRGSAHWVHVTGPISLERKARYACANEAKRWARELGKARAFWVSGGGSYGQDTFRYSRSYGFEGEGV